MNVNGRAYRTIRATVDQVEVIDQTKLPHRFELIRLSSLEDVARAIRSMVVRGAPLIGVAGAYGLAFALRADGSDGAMAAARQMLLETRPTAVNLRWALDRVEKAVRAYPPDTRAELAWEEAGRLGEEDVATCRGIAEHGISILRELADRKKGVVNLLTHCNAGWLACVDWGTALAPVYLAHDEGIQVHVWVDETRPRNQGASLTAFELGNQGIPHTIIADSAGGHLMQAGRVDLCIVGADRVASNGDVANKIGTYPQALAANDNGVPFYVGLPSSSIDWELPTGDRIPIEHRASSEVTRMSGRGSDGSVASVEIVAPGSDALNPAFDVTPARLITGFITERGRCPANRQGLRGLFP